MGFRVAVGTDLYGRKLNAAFDFPQRPGIDELRHSIDAHFAEEERVGRPHGYGGVAFRADTLQQYDEALGRWGDVASAAQIRNGAQLWCFQRESQWHSDTQGAIPDPVVARPADTAGEWGPVGWQQLAQPQPQPQPPARQLAACGCDRGCHHHRGCDSGRRGGRLWAHRGRDDPAAPSPARQHRPHASQQRRDPSLPPPPCDRGPHSPHQRNSGHCPPSRSERHSRGEWAARCDAEQLPAPAAYPARPVVPTPWALGPICNRGERELPGWTRERDGVAILGSYTETMTACAQWFHDCAGGSGRARAADIRVLSIADGVADDRQTDTQAKYVPTSVMLAHGYATQQGPWHNGGTTVRVYGGDIRNPAAPWWQAQQLPWGMPSWFEHRFVALDSQKEFAPQLWGTQQQVPEGVLFDAVMMRHGLCFCDDPAKNSATWPLEVRVAGDKAPAGEKDRVWHGTYQLKHYLHEGRPAYGKDDLSLQWCPGKTEWAIVDASGGAWAYVRADFAHPALLRGPWTVWDGRQHVSDASVACELQGPPPWQRGVGQRVCCCGVTDSAESVHGLLRRCTAVLDARKPGSFALLHGAWTNGTPEEVAQVHHQIEEGARRYNAERRGPYVASVLWRTAAKEYWLQCDGVMLFQPGGAADPNRAYDRTA